MSVDTIHIKLSGKLLFPWKGNFLRSIMQRFCDMRSDKPKEWKGSSVKALYRAAQRAALLRLQY